MTKPKTGSCVSKEGKTPFGIPHDCPFHFMITVSGRASTPTGFQIDSPKERDWEGRLISVHLYLGVSWDEVFGRGLFVCEKCILKGTL